MELVNIEAMSVHLWAFLLSLVAALPYNISLVVSISDPADPKRNKKYQVISLFFYQLVNLLSYILLALALHIII